MKTFAFKLADKASGSTSKWRTRDGVSLAGCSDPAGDGNLRYRVGTRGDSGEYC